MTRFSAPVHAFTVSMADPFWKGNVSLQQITKLWIHLSKMFHHPGGRLIQNTFEDLCQFFANVSNLMPTPSVCECLSHGLSNRTGRGRGPTGRENQDLTFGLDPPTGRDQTPWNWRFGATFSSSSTSFPVVKPRASNTSWSTAVLPCRTSSASVQSSPAEGFRGT